MSNCHVRELQGILCYGSSKRHRDFISLKTHEQERSALCSAVQPMVRDALTRVCLSEKKKLKPVRALDTHELTKTDHDIIA